MIKQFILKILFLLFCVQATNFASTALPILLQNAPNEAAIPKKFRMSTTVLDTKVNSKGLESLNASASGQFSQLGLEEMLKAIPNKKVVVVDLREESHGFLNGDAISWHGEHNWNNLGKTIQEIVEDETRRLAKLMDYGSVEVQFKSSRKAIEVLVLQVASEKEVIELAGAKSVRLPVTDHRRPSDPMVDQFIDWVKRLDQDAWVHFHCSAGKGRASTFFVMYDMIHNANTVPFEDIINRQEALGGKNLSNFNTDWKYQFSSARIKFLKKFYQYCQQGKFKEHSWTNWLKGCEEISSKSIDL